MPDEIKELDFLEHCAVELEHARENLRRCQLATQEVKQEEEYWRGQLWAWDVVYKRERRMLRDTLATLESASEILS